MAGQNNSVRGGSGSIAQAMAAAPRQEPEVNTEVKRDTLRVHFSRVHFKPVTTANEPNTYSDGTVAQKLANMLIEIGETGVTLSGTVQKLTKGTTITIKAQLPSTGGAFRVPVIKALDGDPDAAADLAAFQAWICREFLNWKRGQTAAGQRQINIGSGTVAVNADELAALGI